MKVFRTIIVVLCFFVTGCSLFQLSPYDDQTFKSMTSLKGEVNVFMDDCAEKGASGDKSLLALEAFRVKLSQAYEYESGKNNNSQTIVQMKELKNMFNETYFRYGSNKFENNQCNTNMPKEYSNLKSGCLTTGYCQGKSKNLTDAFDIIISTEKLKNK